MRINAALAQVTAADIWPASAEVLRFNAQVGTIHYSTLIEGNRLGVLEAERAARGELDAKTKAEIELVNYNAIQRNGKSKRWAGKVGVNPPQRGRRTPTR
jgi:hypothetical protein